jgi:hypothetical protein
MNKKFRSQYGIKIKAENLGQCVLRPPRKHNAGNQCASQQHHRVHNPRGCRVPSAWASGATHRAGGTAETAGHLFGGKMVKITGILGFVWISLTEAAQAGAANKAPILKCFLS